MREINHYPKSIKKAIRYIKQEANKEQLAEIKRIIESAIKRRSYILEKLKD
ncbi:hypothetical protein [Bacillus sp. 1P02SD]|uniref:hypothetical protein n=1 Tax=Bacillus sp. 1P02SD TaxID=3132264 RepID=UPI00399F687C